MATTIRLTRMGRKKRPFYRLVVLDNRKRRDGAYLANLGYYNPFTEPHQVELHADQIMSWLSKGATMSETARSLLRSEGVLYRYSLAQQGLDAAQIEVKMATWAQDAENRKQGELNAAAARKEAERKARDEREAAAEAEKAAAVAAAEAETAAAKAAAEAEAAAEAGEAAAEEAAPEAPAEAEAAPEAAETEENAEGDK